MVRRLLSYVVVGGIVFVSAMAPHAPVRPTLPRQLFLLVGQSNMAGRGIVEEVDRVAVDRVVMQDRSLHWIPAVEPVHYDKPGVVGVGPGRAFGVAVAARWSGVEIGLVPAAVGGTSIRAWAPGAADVATHTHPYDDAIGRARAALTDGQLAGILWLQGESDGNADAAADYESRLRDVIAHFRRDLDAPDVPFLIAQLGRFAGSPWNEFRSRVDSAQQRVAATTARVAFVPTDGLRDRGDTVHFDAPSAREIGRRLAMAYFVIAPTPPR